MNEHCCGDVSTVDPNANHSPGPDQQDVSIGRNTCIQA